MTNIVYFVYIYFYPVSLLPVSNRTLAGVGNIGKYPKKWVKIPINTEILAIFSKIFRNFHRPIICFFDISILTARWVKVIFRLYFLVCKSCYLYILLPYFSVASQQQNTCKESSCIGFLALNSRVDEDFKLHAVVKISHFALLSSYK